MSLTGWAVLAVTLALQQAGSAAFRAPLATSVRRLQPCMAPCLGLCMQGTLQLSLANKSAQQLALLILQEGYSFSACRASDADFPSGGRALDICDISGLALN